MRLKLVPHETAINFFGKSNVFFGFSVFAVILSAITYVILGLNFGIDFKGGTSIRSESRACLLYTSPSPRDKRQSRMPSSA